MSKGEVAFFEHYDKWAELADKHGVTIYQIVNAREIWDIAYATGRADGVTEVADIVMGREATNG
jgi:hypothetical protein